MLDYARIEPEMNFTGKSLKTIIEDPLADWRDYLVVELADYKPDPLRKGRLIRMDQYKYNIYSTGEEQLFNLNSDPGEMHNLIGQSGFEYIRTACKDSLWRWAESTNDHFSLTLLKEQ
jgi:hypothetical protein